MTIRPTLVLGLLAVAACGRSGLLPRTLPAPQAAIAAPAATASLQTEAEPAAVLRSAPTELAATARETGTGILVVTHETEGLEPFDEVLSLREGLVARLR